MTAHGVARFVSYDGTELGYRVAGTGRPLVCLPGGPGRSVEYLGDLGGLDRARHVVSLDPRGVGHSADPADPATFGVDRLVRDVESLRIALGLDTMDLLAHSAGAVLGMLYAMAYPHRVARLALITPGLGILDVGGDEAEFTAVLDRAAGQPWYPAANAALRNIFAGDMSFDSFRDSRPLCYGRWDDAAQAHATIGMTPRHAAARAGYFAGVDIDPPAIRAALSMLAAPVLLYAGDRDPMVTPAMVHAAAPVFGNATVVVQPGVGHFPWVDDPASFADAINAFLD